MILRLARAQLRSEWKSSLLGVGVLTFALALATFSMLVAATAITHQNDYFPTHDNDPEFTSLIDTVLGDPISDPDVRENLNPVLSLDQLDQLVKEASKLTPVEAVSFTMGIVSGTDDRHGIIVTIPLTDQTTDRYLAKGNPPGSGQVALNRDLAEHFNLDIGDTLTLESIDDRVPRASITLEISGILYSYNVSPYYSFGPDSIASGEDLETLQRSLPSSQIHDPDAGTTSLVFPTQILWSGNNPILDPYGQGDIFLPSSEFSLGDAFGMLHGPAGWTFLISCIAVVCLVIAALSMARAQAETRTQWSSTSKVLGASDRTIAMASLVETAIVSIGGVGIGLGSGLGLANLHLLWLRSSNPEGLLPASINAPADVFAIGAAVGLGLAVVLAIIPAFWASRVAPAAALKPVTPVSEATLSRSVNPWWPAALVSVAILIAGVTIMIGGSSAWVEGASMVSTIILTVAGIALVIQTARGLVSLTGRVLARSRRAWVLAAGDGILTHRRAFTFAALGTLVTGGISSWWITANAELATDWDESYRGWGEIPLMGLQDWWGSFVSTPGAPTFAAVAFGVVALVAVVVAATYHTPTTKDDTIRGTLGLSRRDERLAVGTRQASVMTAGALAGALGGCAVAIVYHLFLAVLSPSHLVYSLEWNLTLIGHGLVGAATVAGIGAAFALLGGALVSVVSSPQVPQKG